VGQGHPAPNMIKVDVEAGSVPKGAQRIFSGSTPALVCEVHRPEAAAWIARWLTEMQYLAPWHDSDELFPQLLFAEAIRSISPDEAAARS